MLVYWICVQLESLLWVLHECKVEIITYLNENAIWAVYQDQNVLPKQLLQNAILVVCITAKFKALQFSFLSKQ